MKAFIVYSTYTLINNQTYIQLFGRLENRESFAVISEFSPYLYVKEKDLKIIKNSLTDYKMVIQKTKMSTFAEENATKLVFENQAEMNKAKSDIHDYNIDTYEGDIKPSARFLIDKDIFGTINIEGEYEISDKINRIYKNPEITPAEFKPKLKIASIDIETNFQHNKLFCISIYSENYKKCFMITNKTNLKNTLSCKNEEDCLEKFKKELIDLDPDIITGWNVIDFDFKILKELFKKNKLIFDIGRTNEQAKLRIEDNFFRNSSMDIPGRLVLDGLNLIKDPYIKEAPSIRTKKFSSYTLEDVSQKIIGKGKMIKERGAEKHKEIQELYKNNPQKLADYNILDAELAYEIIEKTDTINLAIERALLTGLQLDKITGSIAAFDSLYIREANKRNLVSSTTRFQNKEQRIKGGFVMSPKPGIYNNVLVLDFKSLYPSIIRTFNIDPSSYLEKEEKNSIESPNKAYFKNQEGILPLIIERLHQAREKAKKEKKEFASYAIKIIMNSFFGVLASPNCRYFNLKIANAITNFGQEIIKLTAEKIKKFGYEVIYSDTDSVFVNTLLDEEKSRKLGTEIEDKINEFYKNYIKKKYNRESYLELEFKKFYLSFFMPKLRIGGGGAKKRYAGLIEDEGKEKIEITGLESIRGDWTQAAQEFQKELFEKIFHKENPVEFIKDYIKKLREGKLNDKLVYKKSIRKELKEYTKTTPPHVKAARKLDSLNSNVIEYYLTTDGPEPIQKLEHKIDYEHYINKQIEPIAKQILDLLGLEFEEIIKGSKQSTLF